MSALRAQHAVPAVAICQGDRFLSCTRPDGAVRRALAVPGRESADPPVGPQEAATASDDPGVKRPCSDDKERA